MPRSQQLMLLKSGHNRTAALTLLYLLSVLAAFLLQTAALITRRLRQTALPPPLTDQEYNVITTTECRSGSQLAAALAEPSVHIALIAANIALSASDFAAFPSPIPLQRNFTIRGAYMQKEKWPLLDLGFLRGRVDLACGVTLTFSQLVLDRVRKWPHFQASGMDLIVYHPRDPLLAYAFVLVENSGYIQRTCLPDSIYKISSDSVRRPSELSGSQQLADRIEQWQPCDPDPGAPPMTRCWTRLGMYADTAVYSSDLIGPAAKPTYNHYILWMYGLYYLCNQVMTDACVAAYNGPVGCYYAMFPYDDANSSNRTALVDSGPAAQVPLDVEQPTEQHGKEQQQQQPAQGGDDDSGGRLALLSGGVLGGLVGFAVLVAALVALVVMVRRRRRLCGGEPNGRDGRGANGGASCGIGNGASDGGSKCAGGGGSRDAGGDGASKSLGWMEQRMDGRTDLAQIADNILTSAITRDPRADSSIVITTQSPLLPDVKLDLDLLGHELHLTNIVLGKGSFGRVVEGLYGGVRVAVKLLDMGLIQQTFDSGTACVTPPLAAGHGSGSGRAALVAAVPPAVVALQMDPEAVGGGAHDEPTGAAAGQGHLMQRAMRQEESPEQQQEKRQQLLQQQQRQQQQQQERGHLHHNQDQYQLQHAHEHQQQEGPLAEGIANLPAVAAAAATGAWRTLVQEVEVLARCRHPNIVRLLAASPGVVQHGVSKGACLVMELMDTSLARLMNGIRPRVLPLPLVLHIGMDIAQALSYMHPTILHRDLKPANVLISKADSAQPIVKLADFGLSRLHDSVLVTRNPEVGTGPYMAPETFDVHNNIITDRVDMYALGVILWEMLTGERPWRGLNIFQIAFNVAVRNARPPLHELTLERCPPKLQKIISSCWDAEPGRRLAAAELLKELALVRQQLRGGDD